MTGSAGERRHEWLSRIRPLFALCLALVACPARAADPQVAAPAAADAAPQEPDPARDAAQLLFKKGMALFRSGDLERAADLLLESRKVYASKGNTLNAAIALDRLGRADEALALYEETVTAFGDHLDDSERAALPSVMEALRLKLGALDVSANVTDAVVLVDGRERARLPLTSSIRVLPGDHVVRLIRGGYRTFEGHVHVDERGKAAIDARLERLTDAGTLRVEDATLDDASVFVDGVDVGRAPWEGILAPGQHVVWSRDADRGSEPTGATVLVGQTALVRLRSGPLGAPVEVRTQPRTAAIHLSNGVSLGTGRFQGSLPVGRYDVDVEEEGYRTSRVHLDVMPEAHSGPIDVALVVDPTHPRWPRRPTGKVLVGVDVAFGLGASLGSDAEASCPANCSSAHPSLGTTLFARVAYELPFRLSFDAALGYVAVGRVIDRVVPGPNQSQYNLRDELGLSGFAFGVGAAYRVPLARGIDLAPRLSGGVVLASSRDAITGTASTAVDTVQVQVENTNQQLSATPLFLYPELGVTGTVGHLRLGGALGAFSILGSGPTYDHGAIAGPRSLCPQTQPSSAACLPDSDAIQHEKAYASFVLFTLQLSATYVI